MIQVFLNQKKIYETKTENAKQLLQNAVSKILFLELDDFYLEQNGKDLKDLAEYDLPVHCRLRTLGGKGGFGSMLRAIGAQIEKTTNREACRDLSGRRLRDINEEKRLKTWLEKQSEREREAEEKKKRKIKKLLAVPKHEFKDETYEQARSKLTEKVNAAIEKGFEKSLTNGQDLKRKAELTAGEEAAAKKKKFSLWVGEEFSTDSDDSDDGSASDTKFSTVIDDIACASSKLENSNNEESLSTSIGM